MKSLVKELQKESIDSSTSVNQLLKKALIISKNISDDEFTSWIEKELNGYTNDDDLPDYRKVGGSFKAYNPFHGLVPIDFESVEDAETFSKRNIFQAVGEIEGLYSSSSDDANIESPIPPSIKNSLLKITGGLEPVYILNPTELFGMIERVKNIIFQWTLNLESEGILGDDLEFSPEEKESAKNVTFNINQMMNSQIQSNSSDSVQMFVNNDFDLERLSVFLKELKSSIDKLDITDEEKDEVKSDVKSIESQINSPKPKYPIIREGMKSIKNILEGAAGSIVASELLKRLFNSLV